jgi:hypothetical protein
MYNYTLTHEQVDRILLLLSTQSDEQATEIKLSITKQKKECEKWEESISSQYVFTGI